MVRLPRLRVLMFAMTAFSAATGLGAQGVVRLTLVDRGKASATIVLARGATLAAEFAATELNYHVKKITGTDLPVARDGAATEGVRLLIGESAGTRRLGLANADFANQEYITKFLANTLVLMGRDKPEPPPSLVEVHGNPTRVDGRRGRALRFDGTHDAVGVRQCPFNDEEGTLEAWVWMSGEPCRCGTILRIDGKNPWTYHIVEMMPKTAKVRYMTYDGKKGHGVSSKPLAKGWHHVAATYRAADGKMELSVDGVSQGRNSYVRTTCRGARLGIGGMKPRGASPKAGNPFTGVIDEVRVSNVVRISSADGLYALDERTAVLMHFDEPQGLPSDEAEPLRPSRPIDPPPHFDEQGTCYAVYDFLERYCDVRWYLPTELGLCCPQTDTLAVEGAQVRRAPVMKYRYPYLIDNLPADLCGDTIESEKAPALLPRREATLFSHRHRVGGQQYSANHSFYGFYGRFLKEHPDWFAQGYKGKPPQMCYTNPGFIQQVVQDARDYFDGKGLQPGARAMGDFFALVPMDNSSYCKCPTCQPLIREEADRGNGFFSNDRVSDYVFGFVNKVAREIRKSHPDKYIAALAYSKYAYPPSQEPAEPNVSVQCCLHARLIYSPETQANDWQILERWAAGEPRRPIYLWLYYCFPNLSAKSRQFRCFPGFFAHTVVRQMKRYHELGVRGIFYEPAYLAHSRRSPLMDQLELYVGWKLADNPDLDGNALIDGFFQRYYGAAAKPMQQFYEMVERAYADPANYPEGYRKHHTEEIAWGHLGTEDRMRKLGLLMQEAKAAAATDIEKQRVALFDKGVWQYMLSGRELYLKRKKAKTQTTRQATAPRIESPEPSGDPTKVDWAKAALLDNWRTLMGEPTKRKICARVAHDGQHVYLQLDEHVDTKSLVVTNDVWTEDEWEIFAAKQPSRPYRQMGLNSKSTHIDLAWGEATKTWHSRATVVSDTSAPDRWTVNVALPFDHLLPGGVKPDDTIYLNIIRATRQKRAAAWIPTFGGFHEPSRLGRVVLGK